MSSPSARVPIGQQLAALSQLKRRIDGNPKLLAGFATNADKTYLTEGLTAAIATLDTIRIHADAVRSAIAADRAARLSKAEEAAS